MVSEYQSSQALAISSNWIAVSYKPPAHSVVRNAFVRDTDLLRQLSFAIFDHRTLRADIAAMADSENIFVPVKIDYFINYASPQNEIAGQDGKTPRAYLSPIPKLDSTGLQSNSQFLSHDIFDDMRDRPPNSNGDPNRKTWEHSGISIHWTLPTMYRTGITASAGVDDFPKLCQLGGYPTPNPQDSADGSPIYRQLPNRYDSCM